ncbi:hypothetical protein CPC08DRAFT_183306 [Agrocybe pediades]|nr:hypothetical protein CPC08DRAFT_183306 [Agrocybe pediades]
MKLERLEEALDCCDRCLSYDPDNSGVKTVKERALKAKEEADRKEREKQERIRKEEEKKLKMKMALRVRLISECISTRGPRDTHAIQSCRHAISSSSTNPEVQSIQWSRTSIPRIQLDRRWCYLCSFCTRNTQRPISFRISWKIRHSRHILKPCSHRKYLRQNGTRKGSTSPKIW